MKRTKIVATIGPSSSNYEKLSEMAKCGMNVCRLNFSHNTHKSHLDIIKIVKKIRKDLNLPISILQDLQGPKIRIGDIDKEGIKVSPDEEVLLIYEKRFKKSKTKKIIPVSFEINKCAKLGAKIFIQDGIIELKVTKKDKNFVYCSVVSGGLILPKKGVNIPYAKIVENPLTKKDKEDLKFGLKNDVDWVALSFVKKANDVLILKKEIKKIDPKSKVKVISKIETPEALKDIDNIINVSDAIMIARGDLGVEIEIERIPIVQKDLIAKCIKSAKPVIVATQMLESMIKSIKPTRAEVSDVANAVIDHADAVMLSEETAFGKYPVETVKMMAKIVKTTEASHYDDFVEINSIDKLKNVLAVSETAKDLVLNTDAKIIAVATNSETEIANIARLRPKASIIVFVNSEKLKRQLSMTWGVYSYDTLKYSKADDAVSVISNFIKTNKLARKNDTAVILTNNFKAKQERIDLVRL